MSLVSSETISSTATPPNADDAAREDEARRGDPGPAGFEDRPGAVDVDGEGPIEVELAAGAHHGRQVEDRDVVAIDQGPNEFDIRDVADDALDTGVSRRELRRSDGIEQDDAVDRLLMARRTCQASRPRRRRVSSWPRKPAPPVMTTLMGALYGGGPTVLDPRSQARNR